MRSLSGTLFKGVLTGSVIVFSMAGTILYFSVRAQLVGQLDSALLEQVELLASSVEYKPYGLEVDLEEMRIEDMEQSEPPIYLYIGSFKDRVLYRSPTLGDVPVEKLEERDVDEAYGWVRLPDGRLARSVLHRYFPEYDEEDGERPSGSPEEQVNTMIDAGAAPGEPVFIQLYRESADIDRFFRIFLVLLVITGLGSLGILSLAIKIVIGKAARPVDDLAERIGNISNADLTVRIDGDTVFRELAPVVNRFNCFMDRLEDSFSREKAFTSDAAHELRTPLAGVKSTLEVALARERTGGEYRETLNRALAILNQLENLVVNLLALSRLESGQEVLSRTEVNLEELVRDTWKTHIKEAREKDIRVVFDLEKGIRPAVDAHLLVHILNEIFRNAVYYANDGGTVGIVSLRNSHEVSLEVRNTGSRIADEDAYRVFDRFWRGRASRSEAGERFGLGLSLARRMIQSMSGRMDVSTKMGGEFVITITLPM